MNRWSEAFEKNEFISNWNSVFDSAESVKLSAEVTDESVTEFSRFIKVIKLINSVILNVDRDTFHLQTFANANAPIIQVQNHLNLFVNSGYPLKQVQAANNELDKILNMFRPYMIMPDAVANGIKEVAITQGKLIEQLNSSLVEASQKRLKELEETLGEAKSHLQDIEDDSEKSHNLYLKLFGEDGNSGLSSEIDSLHNSIQSMQAQATKSSKTIQNLELQITQSNTLIEGYESNSKQTADEIKQLLVDTEKELKDLKSFYLKVFGIPNEEGELVGGIKAELEEYKQDFSDYEKDRKIKIEELIKEIESLLPGAVSAGLASAYKKLKNEYHPSIKYFTRLFYFSLAVLLTVGGVAFYHAKEVTDTSGLVFNLLQGSTIILPALWFAVFTSRRRNEYQRLQHEYAHKEAVTSSYQSFKQQIDNLDEEQSEMLERLLAAAIKTIDYNATQSLDKHFKESPPIMEPVYKVLSKNKVTKGSDTGA